MLSWEQRVAIVKPFSGCIKTSIPSLPPGLPANQVVDSGLDETSCFFADGDGQEVAHGYYFEELSEALAIATSEGNYLYYTSQGFNPYTVRPDLFAGGDFSFDPSRRKVGILRGTRSWSNRSASSLLVNPSLV